jgi:hypothetical protein
METDFEDIKIIFDSICAQAPRTQKLILESIYHFLLLCIHNHKRVNVLDEFSSMRNLFYKIVQCVEIEDIVQKLSQREKNHLKICLQSNLDLIVNDMESDLEMENLQLKIDVYLLERSIRLISVLT